MGDRLPEAGPPAAAPLHRVLLGLILVLAAGLRFTGLDWGLRHHPHADEAYYVASVVAMLEAGDLDHRYRPYPGLFFYLLGAVLAPLGPESWRGSTPYLVARAVTAAVGVLNVWLLARVASRLFGRTAGLSAALLLAVSPLDVRTAHQVRPDVLVQGAGILAVDFFARLGTRLRDDVRAGLLIGLATSVKLTGVFLVPFYLAARLLRPGPRPRGMLVAGALTVALPFVFTPYAFVHFDAQLEGVLKELHIYYVLPQTDDSFTRKLASYIGHLQRAMGPVAALLAVAGALLWLSRSWRQGLPPLLLPATVLLTVSTAQLEFPRKLLPGMGVAYLLAGSAISRTARRPWLAAALALAAAGPPLHASAGRANLLARPSEADEALDWIEHNLPDGARILETRPAGIVVGSATGRGSGEGLGVDRARHEIVYHEGARYEGAESSLARLARHFDLVVTDSDSKGGWSRNLELVAVFRYRRAPASWFPIGKPRLGNVALSFRMPREKTRLVALNLSAASWTASSNPEAIAAAGDGDDATAWNGSHPEGLDWLAVEWPASERVAAIEVAVAWSDGVPPYIDFELGDDQLEPLEPVVHIRPTLFQQHGARLAGSQRPYSEFVLAPGRPARRLRVAQTTPRTEPFQLRELRVFVDGGRDAP